MEVPPTQGVLVSPLRTDTVAETEGNYGRSRTIHRVLFCGTPSSQVLIFRHTRRYVEVQTYRDFVIDLIDLTNFVSEVGSHHSLRDSSLKPRR